MIKTFIFFCLAFIAKADLVQITPPTTFLGVGVILENTTAEWTVTGATNYSIELRTMDNAECTTRLQANDDFECAKEGDDFEMTALQNFLCNGPCVTSFSVTTYDTPKVKLPVYVGVQIDVLDIETNNELETHISFVRLTDDKVSELKISDANATEGESEFFNFTATLDRSTSTAIKVDYYTQKFLQEEGSATPGSDYVHKQSSFMIGGDYGESVSFQVELKNDDLQESMETFEVKIDIEKTEFELLGLFHYTPREVLGVFLEETEGVTISIVSDTKVEEGSEEYEFEIVMSHHVATDVTLPVKTAMNWQAINPANRFPNKQFTPLPKDATVTFSKSNHFDVTDSVIKQKVQILNDNIQSPFTGAQGVRSSDAEFFFRSIDSACLRSRQCVQHRGY
jgi:hypothetical protein